MARGGKGNLRVDRAGKVTAIRGTIIFRIATLGFNDIREFTLRLGGPAKAAYSERSKRWSLQAPVSILPQSGLHPDCIQSDTGEVHLNDGKGGAPDAWIISGPCGINVVGIGGSVRVNLRHAR